MKEKLFQTPSGPIYYWINTIGPTKPCLVFLPGLTADHRLFDKQIDYFKSRYKIFVWDAPGHAASWPFLLNFSLMDKAQWLFEILNQEKMLPAIIIGQSMGGYVGQAFSELFPDQLKGFISIDSAPLQKKYMTDLEIALLKRMETVYRHYPWKSLVKSGSKGVAVSPYGQELMREMMMIYEGDQDRYSRLAGHGYRILAQAMEEDLPYALKCPALLMCGEKDQAGSCKRYNRAWHKETKIPLCWIKDAGHNANTDQPEIVNHIIESFILDLE